MANRWGSNGNSGLGSKITANGDCSHEIKRCLLLGKKALTNLDSVLNRRNTTLANKGLRIKAMVFPVVMQRCEILTINMLSTKELMLSNCGVGEDS